MDSHRNHLITGQFNKLLLISLMNDDNAIHCSLIVFYSCSMLNSYIPMLSHRWWVSEVACLPGPLLVVTALDDLRVMLIQQVLNSTSGEIAGCYVMISDVFILSRHELALLLTIAVK